MLDLNFTSLGFDLIANNINSSSTPGMTYTFDPSLPDYRYMVLNASTIPQGSANDEFRITSITASTSVPEPSSIALLALGMLGLSRINKPQRGKAQG